MSAENTNRFAAWFGWLRRGGHGAVLADYGQIRKGALADIAVRARLWNADAPTDPALRMAYDLGRRAMALEIFELAGADPAQIEKFIKARITQP